jgi:hypothetical protein
MKLKYYLRGMGIGIILTAIVMGFALGGRKATLSNAQIIERAKALGMVEQSEGVLSETQNDKQEANSNDSSTSNKTLDTIREEIPKEDDKELASADTSVQPLDEKKEESTKETGSAEQSVAEASVDKAVSEASTEKQDSKKTDTRSDAGSEKSSENTVDTSSESASQEVVETIVPETTAPETTKPETETETVSAPAPTPVSGKTVTIPGGLGSEAVAAILVREGIVDNAVSFNQYLVTTGKDRTIRSGTKVIPEGASYEEVANIITKG